MTPERWHEVTRIFRAALDRQPASRPEFLSEACRHDPLLRAAVEAMLASDSEAGSIGATPASAPPLTPGTHIGAFRIEGLLGVGGMGEVYKARDTRLGRDVALKVLPPTLTSDRDRLARFEREARALAALNHPNIAAIHGIEEGSMPALVLELVDGPTLAERVAQGPLAADEALRIARQIAEAIEAAHNTGIVHRDLKPANIKITAAGTVKVLDFGLARDTTLSASALTSSDVRTAQLAQTEAGLILGTAAYMSPEQARGAAVDQRTDIWAFGCVLFEMLTGRSPFARPTLTDTLAAVVEREPNWATLPGPTHPSVVRLLRRCLQKDPARRLHHIADARIEIDDAASSAEAVGANTVPTIARQHMTSWVLLAAALIGAAALGWTLRRPAGDPPDQTTLAIITPPARFTTSFALSPDGRHAVFEGLADGRSQLLLHDLADATTRPLPGTENGIYPFWSPNGESIGFFADLKLKRIEHQTGAVRELATAQFPSGGSWNRNGVILFVPGAGRPVMRVSDAGGGEPTPVSPLAQERQFNLRSPVFLADGRRFLYYVGGVPAVRGIYLGDIDTRQATRLVDADAMGAFVPPGRLLYVQQGNLLAQSVDPQRLAPADSSAQVVARGIVIDDQNVAAVSVSSNGTIAYRTGTAGFRRRLAWFDRSTRLAWVGDSDVESANAPSLSLDERHVVMYRTIDSNMDLYRVDTTTGARDRLTTDPENELNAVWSQFDGSIFFSRTVKGNIDIFRRSTTGSNAETRVLSDTSRKAATDISWDGRYMLYRRDEGQGYDLWVKALMGDGPPVRLTDTPSIDEREGQFSPDGKWIAYQSNKSDNRFDIYVQSFPERGEPILVSTQGGAQVRWHPRGRELFYVALDGWLMSVRVAPSADGKTLRVERPERLFMTNIGGAVQGPRMQQYVVSRAGRFLMNTITDEASVPITLVQNWSRPLR